MIDIRLRNNIAIRRSPFIREVCRCAPSEAAAMPPWSIVLAPDVKLSVPLVLIKGNLHARSALHIRRMLHVPLCGTLSSKKPPLSFGQRRAFPNICMQYSWSLTLRAKWSGGDAAVKHRACARCEVKRSSCSHWRKSSRTKCISSVPCGNGYRWKYYKRNAFCFPFAQTDFQNQSTNCLNNDISLTRYDIRLRLMICLRSKHDIISVPFIR